ncbi:MAG: hypothetical protein V3U63_01665 [Gemmatimonadota bacterium]
MEEPTEAEPTASTNAERVLTHSIGTEVKLASGEHVLVRPWGYRTGKRLMGRLGTVLKMLAMARTGQTTGIGDLLSESYDELIGIMADTIGMSLDDVDEKMLMEDILNVIGVILDVNFIQRPQLVKAIESLIARAEALMPEEPAAPTMEDTELETNETVTPTSSEKPSSS